MKFPETRLHLLDEGKVRTSRVEVEECVRLSIPVPDGRGGGVDNLCAGGEIGVAASGIHAISDAAHDRGRPPARGAEKGGASLVGGGPISVTGRIIGR